MADSIDLCKLFFTDNEKGENFYSSHCRNESMAEVVPHKIAGSLIFRDLPLLSLSPELRVQYTFVKFVLRCIF